MILQENNIINTVKCIYLKLMILLFRSFSICLYVCLFIYLALVCIIIIISMYSNYTTHKIPKIYTLWHKLITKLFHKQERHSVETKHNYITCISIVLCLLSPINNCFFIITKSFVVIQLPSSYTTDEGNCITTQAFGYYKNDWWKQT